MINKFFDILLKIKLVNKIGITNKDEAKKMIVQFMKFGLIGFFNTAINLIVYYIFLSLGAYYIIAYLLGFLVSILNAYYWNKKYVFKYKTNHIYKNFAKMFLSYSATLALNTVLLFLLVDILLISDKAAPLINLIVTVPINFMFNRLWVFN